MTAETYCGPATSKKVGILCCHAGKNKVIDIRCFNRIKGRYIAQKI